MTVHSQTLVDMENSGCVAMLRDERIDDLRRMYDLFTRVPHTLECLREAVCEHVKRTGRELVSDQERIKDPVEFVKGLLQMRDKYDRVVSDAFRAEKKAQKKLKEAFEDFINADSRCASYLVLYIHELLQSSLKAYSEEDADRELDKVIVIFRYLQDKDIFENFYKQHLAKRLLGQRSVSEDAERSMIGKLKIECGYQYTSKLEGMFMDMRVSADTREAFRNAMGGSSKVGSIELHVDVLTTGFWPTQVGAKCSLPPQILRCCEVFKEHYLKQHSGRRLQWQANMGNADLKAVFSGRKYEINVSTYMMCVLVLFNQSDALSYSEILEATEIPAPDLQRALQSLACAKFKILNKEPKGRNVEDGDSFSFNSEFSAKHLRFKVGTVTAAKENEVEKQETRQKVDEDRKPQIEAAIVRVMKSRQQMEHNALIAEVTAQLTSRFLPHPNVIKKRIESLIEREFLERDKDNWRKYRYLA